MGALVFVCARHKIEFIQQTFMHIWGFKRWLGIKMIITHAYLSFIVTAIAISMKNAWLNKGLWNTDKEPIQAICQGD